jgi:hypothetical protein
MQEKVKGTLEDVDADVICQGICLRPMS